VLSQKECKRGNYFYFNFEFKTIYEYINVLVVNVWCVVFYSENVNIFKTVSTFHLFSETRYIYHEPE